MKAAVLLSNDFDEKDPGLGLSRQVCLVIDVIRATSTITAAFAAGAQKVVVSKNKDGAFTLKRDQKNIILCGEEGGVKIPGFDYDNSPLQLSRLSLQDKTVVIKTTNGTNSFIKAQKAQAALVLSLLNLHHSVNAALILAQKLHADILFLCSGKLGMVSYDDAYVAGVGLRYLAQKVNNLELEDTAELVLNAACQEGDSYGALVKSRSAQCALRLGLEDDIRFSSTLNKYSITGKMKVERGFQGSDGLLTLTPL
jgi:2-phosphosulfolactate phosphatase